MQPAYQPTAGRPISGSWLIWPNKLLHRYEQEQRTCEADYGISLEKKPPTIVFRLI